jgi:hypothetical protein
MENDDRIFVCYSQKLAAFFLDNGLRLLALQTNFNNPKFNVFIFKRSEKLEQLLTEYQKDKEEKGLFKEVF